MLIHLFNLLGRSFVDFPTVISGNWLSILLPLIIFAIKDGRSFYRQHKQGLPMMSAATKRDTWLLALIYLGIFGLAIIRTVYRDHEYLKEKASSFRQTIHNDGENLRNIKQQDSERYIQLQVECAHKGGVVETLQNQNRDQQSTINNCQTQALKLLAPEALKITVLTLDDTVSGVDHKAKYLILTNKTITPVRMLVSCDRQISGGFGSILGSGVMSGGSGNQTPNSLSVNIDSPAWTPISPMIVAFSYTSTVPIQCYFDER